MKRIPNNLPNIKIRSILFAGIFLSLAFMTVNMLLTYSGTIKAVEISISSQSMKTAASIAEQMDVASYERFLQNASADNLEYWKLRDFLNDFRMKIGAKYVYTVIFDDQKKSKVMINGQPRSASLETYIGEACTLTYEEALPAFQGKTFHTGIIHDPKYGDYLTSGAPILNSGGQLIGIIGIDISIEMLEEIKHNVLIQSLSYFITNLLVVTLFLIAYVLLRRWHYREILRAVGDAEQTFQGEFRSILVSIRSIRHDFANHLQVLFGLLELQRYTRARDYVRSLLKEVKVVDLTIQIANPALLVLLHSKWELAKTNQIEFDFQVPPEETFEGVLSTDLIKILSNLLDNAIEAAAENPVGERNVFFSLQKGEKTYQLMVENSGPTIPASELDKMMEYGYTTKGTRDGKPRGFGLMIVSEVVKKYGGEIHVTSRKGKTRVSVFLLLRQQEKLE